MVLKNSLSGTGFKTGSKIQKSSEMASSKPECKLTKDEKKELALLVAGGRISARTAERAVGLSGSGSSLLYYVKTVWGGVNLTSPGSKALREQYEKKFLSW